MPYNIVIYWGDPPPSPPPPVLRDIWAAPYKSSCRNKLVSSIHKSFRTTNNLSLSQAISYLCLMDYPIVNRDDFFSCFHYDIKSPFLVLVLKVTTSSIAIAIALGLSDIWWIPNIHMMDLHHMMDTHHKLLAIHHYMMDKHHKLPDIWQRKQIPSYSF